MAHKVLIVDDEPNIVTSLTFLMKKSGFDTSVARDGDQALTEVERFRPDPAQDHPAHGQGSRDRGRQRSGHRRRCLCHQAVLDQGAGRARARAAGIVKVDRREIAAALLPGALLGVVGLGALGVFALTLDGA